MKLLKTQEMAEMTEFYPCFLTSKLPQLFRGHQFTPGLLIWANAGRCTCHLTVVLLLSSATTCPLPFVGSNYFKALARQGSSTVYKSQLKNVLDFYVQGSEVQRRPLAYAMR